MKRLPLLFTLVILISCTRSSSSSEPILESIKLSHLGGGLVDLAQYKGKTVFINFWATWCRPCIDEMPSIERAQQLLKDKKIEFLFASSEDVERIQKFKEEQGLNLHFVLAENMDALGIGALPTTFIIDPKGQLVFSEIGYRQWDSPENLEVINKILKDK